MSDEVETMFSVREEPWHKKGVILDLAPRTVSEAMRYAGLDWTVSLRQIFTPEELVQKFGLDVTDGKQVPEDLRNLTRYRAVMRDTDNKCLGVVTTKYHVLQNVDAFEFFDPFINGHGEYAMGARYETAGSLFGGRVIWVLVKMPDSFVIGRNDTLRQYLLLANGHAGSLNCIVQPTDIRVVCNNTLQASLGCGNVCRIRHTASMKDNLNLIQTQILEVHKARVERHALYTEMYNTTVLEADVTAYLNDLFPAPADEGRERTIALKKQATVRHLLETGQGVDIPGVKGTLWWLYNAIVEYVDWYSAFTTERIKDKTAYVLAGGGAELKTRAYNAAVDRIAKK